MNPDITLGLLYSRPVPAFWPFLLGWLSIPYDALHPHFGMVHARYVARARQKRKRVNVWTVNDPRDMRRMRDLGVDAIITNYPDVLANVLGEG
jgi:glycerophosphoryl diester phosphodiesterase